MNPKNLQQVEVDEHGRLVLPAELADRFNLYPGYQVEIEEFGNSLRILRPVQQIARIYVEVTNICNLDCVTCMRNIWEEPLGRMNDSVFETILEGILEIQPRPTVFFGGLGEPLIHPKIVDMVQKVKEHGASVELITNGINLSEKMILKLTDAGLDILWVSLDGATPESYGDIRLGASLTRVINNLKKLRTVRHRHGFQHDPKPELGIAFVAMKRNVAELPEILRLGTSLGARYFSISNLLPHTDDMNREILFDRTQMHHNDWRNTHLVEANLPRIDHNHWTQSAISEFFSRQMILKVAGSPINQSINTCPFIEKGSLSIRWDGAVSPCIPLLHSSSNFLGVYQRKIHAHIVGNLTESSLPNLWHQPEYTEFRTKVRRFDFSPCTSCTGCDLSRENREDCLANTFPTCGGCLYAQGLIQCP